MKQNSALLLFCVFLSALSFAQQKYSLQDALRTAQQNNPTLQAERLNIDYNTPQNLDQWLSFKNV